MPHFNDSMTVGHSITFLYIWHCDTSLKNSLSLANIWVTTYTGSNIPFLCTKLGIYLEPHWVLHVGPKQTRAHMCLQIVIVSMFNSFMLRGLPMNMEGTTNTRPNVMLLWCASTDLDYELCNYGIHLTLIIESMVLMSRGLSTSYKIKIMWLCRTPSFFNKTTNVHITTFLYTW